jgi:hypothetical protein
LSIRRWRKPEGIYHPFGTGKDVEVLSPVNEVPASNGSLIGFKGEKSIDFSVVNIKQEAKNGNKNRWF